MLDKYYTRQLIYQNVKKNLLLFQLKNLLSYDINTSIEIEILIENITEAFYC